MVVSMESKQTNYILSNDNFFYCTSPTKPNFWQIKIIMIILISHKNLYFFYNLYFF